MLICSYCPIILKDPLILPCKHNICAHHLKEASILKQNLIQCSQCNQTFNLNDNVFTFNDLVKKLLDEGIFLNEEEKSLKRQLEENLNNSFKLHEDLMQSKNSLDLECFNHFQEIRFKINQHREELKQRIDEMALEMIDQVKTFESSYLKNLNLKLEKSFKTYDEEMNDLVETFRDSNLQINKIKQMKHEQEMIFLSIKSKLTESSKVKEHLKSNEFKPCFSLDFGQLRLFEFVFDPFQSQIVNEKKALDLIE